MKTIESIEIVNLTDELWLDKVTSPFKRWLAASNGKVEAGIFKIKPKLRVEHVNDVEFMKKLEMKCFRDLISTQFHVHERLPATEIYENFKDSVNFGPAYGAKLSEDELTRVVNQSLLALMNVPASDKDIPILMESYIWYEFRATTSWFYNVAWDVGIIALDASNNKISILAATDTD
jgi:hypothetical protein